MKLFFIIIVTEKLVGVWKLFVKPQLWIVLRKTLWNQDWNSTSSLFFSWFLCMFSLHLKTTEKCWNAICHFTKAKLSSWNIYIRPVLVDIKLQKSQLLILATAKPIVQDIFTSLLCDLKLSQPPKTQLVGDDP